MVRGLYAAAAGIFTQQKAFNTTSNNIANSTTSGFKAQNTIESSFGEHVVNRMSSLGSIAQPNIGTGAFMTVNSDTYTDFTQGNLEDTGRSVDMALNGKGFFLVESETLGQVVTRNGQFELNADGELILPGVGKVLNDGGSTITLDGSNFAVSGNGVISIGGDEVDMLAVVIPDGEGVQMKSVGNGAYQSDNYTQAEEGTYQVLQGKLEVSNVNMAQEMSKLIAGQNHYSSCAQIIKMYDKINEITVNQVGKIG